jgi:hypothetical protein
VPGPRDRDVDGEDERREPALADARDELAGALAVLPDVELEPALGVGRLPRELLDRGRAERRERVRHARAAGCARDGRLAGAVHHAREACRAEDDRQRRGAAEDRRRRIDGGHVVEHVRVERQARERVHRPVAGELRLGRAFDVVEHRPGRALHCEAVEVGHRPHTVEWAGPAAPERGADEAPQLGRRRETPLHSRRF